MIDFARQPPRDGLDDPQQMAHEMAREVVEQVLRANPDAGLDEVNAALERRMREYNAAPQAELGGLSPDRVLRLQLDRWDNGGVVRIREDLPATEVEATSFAHDALLLLDRLAEGPVRLTKAGNLPRALVADHLRNMLARESFPGELERARNEADVRPLKHLRVLLKVARLTRRVRGELRITRLGLELSAAERRGRLYAHLFRVWFRELNLAYLDGALEAPGFQALIAFSLYRFRELGGKWRTTRELSRLCLLPAVREELPVTTLTWPGRPDSVPYDESLVPMETRFLRPLARFGLARTEEARDPRDLGGRRWRKTPLLDRFVRFDW